MKKFVISAAFAAVLAASPLTPSMADEAGVAVGGAALGSMTGDDEVWIRDDIASHPHTTVTIEEPVVVGKPLPSEVIVYEIEGNPRFTEYRYAYVNGHHLLIDRDGNVAGTIVN